MYVDIIIHKQYIDVYRYIDIQYNIYTINLQTAAISLFESSSVQLISNKDLEGLECSNYSQSCERSISLAATIVAKFYIYIYIYIIILQLSFVSKKVLFIRLELAVLQIYSTDGYHQMFWWDDPVLVCDGDLGVLLE